MLWIWIRIDSVSGFSFGMWIRIRKNKMLRNVLFCFEVFNAIFLGSKNLMSFLIVTKYFFALKILGSVSALKTMLISIDRKSTK
jgi:hypothetical protein